MEEQYCNQLEIWGGIECTINRVKNKFFDQCHYSGHYDRSSDIMDIANLGISRLRYPLLWEKHQPEKNQEIDWSWTEGQLNKIRTEGIEVIAGLVHHGSGPSYTNLLDKNFPELLAEYAAKVAYQFPWIEYYTPVNEPLTTARFSGLYGFWYPHKKNAASFFQMLLHQLKATVLAMKEIRKINPNAKLVQTEDLGKTYSTPRLQYQADFENERRWLSFDILCGRFNEEHPLWKIFSQYAEREELDFFIENPCIPDVFGFNHYLTSERYIDENISAFPTHTHGGNGRHRYADVEAVRVELEEQTGIKILLEEAWERFRKPMALTEVHLHCHREEQLRWFRYIYEACSEIKNKGIDIIAITSWALLGSFGWNRLLTQPGGDYEPGAFDISNGVPRPTALAGFIKNILENRNCDHPLTSGQGWWLRNSRILYGPVIKQVRMKTKNSKPIIIIGKNGTLGKAFARVCEGRDLDYVLVSRKDCDVSSVSQVEQLLETIQPWAVINAAGFVRVDDAEKECEPCFRDNTKGPAILAKATAKRKIQLVSFSSDLVFDGQKNAPYLESDQVNPLNIYGISKAHSEELVQELYPEALIIRTSAFFSPWDEYNFVHYVRTALSQDEVISVASDAFISPTYVPDLVHVTLDLLMDQEKGIWHLANQGDLSWAQFAQRIAAGLNLNEDLLRAITSAEMGMPALRPLYSVLGTERGQILPSLDHAIERYISEIGIDRKRAAISA
jgi:dTDP-4-dehydrorhamnose reductase